MRRAGLAAVACALAASCAAPPPAQAPRQAEAPVASGQLPIGRPLAPPRASGGAAVVLRNPGFEEPMRSGAVCLTGWDCIMHSASDSFRFFSDDQHPAKGARSGCFESVGTQPWGKLMQGHVNVESLRGRRVRLRALARLEKVAGSGAGPLIIAQGGSGNELASRFEPQAGTSEWHPVSAELEVPQGTYLLELGFALVGHGRLCVDDVRFEVL